MQRLALYSLREGVFGSKLGLELQITVGLSVALKNGQGSAAELYYLYQVYNG